MTAENKRRTNAERGHDAYFTPPEAVRALLHIEAAPAVVVAPCVGDGAIVKILEESGRYVEGADIVDYGWPGTVVEDFLTSRPVVAPVVTNPPYLAAEQFLKKILDDGCPYCALLLRTNFLESVRRKVLLDASPPARIWNSSRRLPTMHQFGWTGNKVSSNVFYSWFVWDTSSPTKNQLGRFDWADYSPRPARKGRAKRAE
jgi:hypothetical protein